MSNFRINPTRIDPYKNFRFRIKWKDKYVAGFSEMFSLRPTTIVTHREARYKSPRRRIPAHNEYNAITLKKGVTYDKEFEKWTNNIRNFSAGSGSKVTTSMHAFRRYC